MLCFEQSSKLNKGSTDMVTENEINHLQDVYNDAIAREPDYTGKCFKLRNTIKLQNI